MLSFPATDTVASGYIRRRVRGCASGPSRFGFRQVRRGATCISIHRHLTIRSSRPHVAASAMCFTLRLHMSAAPPRVGLTQALGGRNAFCNCVAYRVDSPASVSASFRKDCRRTTSSSKSAGRAHTSHALRSPASEASLSFVQFPALHAATSDRPS